MTINPNLWSLMLTRWLGHAQQVKAMTTIGFFSSARAHGGSGLPRPGQAPPLRVERLSRHLRRDIGIDLDRV